MSEDELLMEEAKELLTLAKLAELERHEQDDETMLDFIVSQFKKGKTYDWNIKKWRTR